MKKIIIMLILVIMLSAATVYAENTIATLPTFDVTINGQKVESLYRQYPLIVYKDITYVPMTYFDCRFLGLTTNWDSDARTLSIKKENIACAYREYNQEFANKKNFTTTVCDFDIIVNNENINNSAEQYPLITFRDVTYFPLTWRFAVEEFGWEYSFDRENGLVINSSNYHTETIKLQNISGSAVFDGEYYYYNGKMDNENLVYTVFHEATDNPYVLHHLPDTNLSRSAGFKKSYDGMYIAYTAGTSPLMSTQMFYKIDGQTQTVKSEKPDSYFYSTHGYSEIGVRDETISVFCENPYFDSATKITYTKNGETHEMPALPGRVRVGCCRVNGKTYDRASSNNCIKISGDKIYFMAFDYETKDCQSAIYVIDTNNNTVEKIIDKADGAFYVYNGWTSAMNSNSTMIIYGKDGSIYRYVEANDKETLIYDGSENTDMVLCGAVGVYNVYACLKSLDGGKTVVMLFDAYADGSGEPTEIFSTRTGTNSSITDGKLIIRTSGESSDDKVRLLVVGNNEKSGKEVDFRTSDVCTWVSVCDTHLLYGVDGKPVKVELE